MCADPRRRIGLDKQELDGDGGVPTSASSEPTSRTSVTHRAPGTASGIVSGVQVTCRGLLLQVGPGLGRRSGDSNLSMYHDRRLDSPASLGRRTIER